MYKKCRIICLLFAFCLFKIQPSLYAQANIGFTVTLKRAAPDTYDVYLKPSFTNVDNPGNQFNFVGVKLAMDLPENEILTAPNLTFTAAPDAASLFGTNYTIHQDPGYLAGGRRIFGTFINSDNSFHDYIPITAGVEFKVATFNFTGGIYVNGGLTNVRLSDNPFYDPNDPDAQGGGFYGNALVYTVMVNQNFTTSYATVEGPGNGMFYDDGGATTTKGLDQFGNGYVQLALPLLPVTLLNFDAVKSGNNVNLNWSTAQESNAGYFVVERCADGASFQALSNHIAAAGFSSVQKTYTYQDTKPLPGLNYYRLRMVDIDGKTKYSSTQVLKFNGTDKIIVLPTVTVDGYVHVLLPASVSNEASVMVFDSQGKNMMTVNSKGNSSVEINLSELAKGVYLLKLNDPAYSDQTFRVINK